MYKTIWIAIVGEVVECRREPDNCKDRYAVAVIKDDAVIGHLPRTISKLCSIFLRRGCTIQCRVIGSRQYSAGLPQGGLEIPCLLTFKGLSKEIKKLKKHLPAVAV